MVKLNVIAALRKIYPDCVWSERNLSNLQTRFIKRCRYHYLRNLADPGDCANDPKLLLGLAIAMAEIGYGWIPEVQRRGCEIAKLI